MRDPRTKIQHLLKLIEDVNYVSWIRRRYGSDVMREICWAHPNSFKLCYSLLFPTSNCFLLSFTNTVGIIDDVIFVRLRCYIWRIVCCDKY